jgi:GT2 family glycosyltransferase
MNGNCVLVPARAVEEIGVHSEHFRHSSGDVDYGLRARKAGYQLFQSPHVVGHTPYNAEIHAKRARLTWSNRHFILCHPKGVPVTEWLHFCRAHGGLMWPVNFISRYLKILRLGA